MRSTCRAASDSVFILRADCLDASASSRKILNEAISRMSISACAHAPRVFAMSAHRRSMSDITARNPFSTRSGAWCFAISTFWTSDSLTTGGNVARLRSPIHYGRRARRSIARCPGRQSHPCSLSGINGACAAIAEERARHLRERGERALLLLRERDVLHLKGRRRD